jgi:hypothetical protein
VPDVSGQRSVLIFMGRMSSAIGTLDIQSLNMRPVRRPETSGHHHPVTHAISRNNGDLKRTAAKSQNLAVCIRGPLTRTFYAHRAALVRLSAITASAILHRLQRLQLVRVGCPCDVRCLDVATRVLEISKDKLGTRTRCS